MSSKNLPRVTLAGSIYLFVLVGAFLGAVFTFVVLRDATTRMTERAMQEAVTVRSAGVQAVLARELSREWRRLESLSALIIQSNQSNLQNALDLVVAEDGKVSWVGFASVDGVVLQGSNRLLEGVTVADRPWFQRGLEGPFARDVHDSVLLAKAIGAPETDPPRLIDFSMPVDTVDGRRLGVVGLYVNFEWMAQLVDQMAAALEIEALVVSQNGRVIISTLDANPAEPTIEPFRLAALGATDATLSLWPDGNSYYSVVQPILASDQTPSFGWRLIARVDQEAFASIRLGVTSALLPFVAGLVCILAVATVVYVRLFVAPVAEAAENARAIAEGGDLFPFESYRTRELAQLSAAIARLQRANPAASNEAATRTTSDAIDPPPRPPRAP